MKDKSSKKRLEHYIDTLKVECRHARDKDEESYCVKTIARLEDIVNGSDMKKTLKHYRETLKSKQETAINGITYQFFKEVIARLKDILK